MKQLFFICCLLFVTSFFAQSETGSTPTIAIKIKKGESVKVHDVIVKFTDVREDSRCPKYTNCIWAGRAIVQLEVTDEKGGKQDISVILGETTGNESKDRTIYRRDGYLIEAIDLNPYPEEGKESTPYTLLVSERK